jgi:hypothetical protein
LVIAEAVFAASKIIEKPSIIIYLFLKHRQQ